MSDEITISIPETVLANVLALALLGIHELPEEERQSHREDVKAVLREATQAGREALR